MSRLSAEAEANRSGLSGLQLMAVMVFLCSDMMDLSLNSLYCWSNYKRETKTLVIVTCNYQLLFQIKASVLTDMRVVPYLDIQIYG